MKKRICICCSLTNAPELFRSEITNLMNDLRSNFDVIDFLLSPESTAEEAFKWGTHRVESSDLVVAIVDFPSIGLGYEIGLALQLKKPIYAFAQKDLKVTRLLQGIKVQNFHLSTYDDFSSLKEIILKLP